MNFKSKIADKLQKIVNNLKKDEIKAQSESQKKELFPPMTPDEQKEYDLIQDQKNLTYALSQKNALENAFERAFQVTEIEVAQPRPISQNDQSYAMDSKTVIAMDDSLASTSLKPNLTYALFSPALINWYAAQSFIGYQLCALFSQHWLVSKACFMPGEDAIRKGYDICINDGTKIEPDIQNKMRQLDKKYRINENMIEYVGKGRIFGIRVVYFEVETDDPIDYYYKPFNPDGIKPGTYKGIVQVDPFWIVGQLDADAAGNPASQYFYEPTWWLINGMRIHRTHVVIYRNEELADTLKPTYLWGSVPVSQKIYERVYNSERVANESPLLCLTKRTRIYKTDLAQAVAKGAQLTQRMQNMVDLQNNYGISVIDDDDEMLNLETSLSELDTTIMTQYQLVAAAAGVPAVKLLGTPPKGFNSTGEFEEASYHEFLETLQTNKISKFLERHYMLMIRSDIVPLFHVEPFEVDIEWKPLDALTEEEQANINKTNSDAAKNYAEVGAIDGDDIRDKLIGDPISGYNGIESGAPGIDAEFSDEDEE